MLAQLGFIVAVAGAEPSANTSVKPLREMTFAFHFAGSDNTHMVETLVPGMDVSYDRGGYDGTIHVQALGIGANGALVLRMWQDVPRARSLTVPPGQMLVFGSGEILFDRNQAKFSAPELDLARFLGRGFVDGNHMDEKNHWQVLIDEGEVHVQTDFTVMANNGGLLQIAEARTLSKDNTKWKTEGEIRYDLNRAVPLDIHEALDGLGAAFETHMTFDYTLTADSLADRQRGKP